MRELHSSLRDWNDGEGPKGGHIRIQTGEKLAVYVILHVFFNLRICL